MPIIWATNVVGGQSVGKGLAGMETLQVINLFGSLKDSHILTKFFITAGTTILNGIKSAIDPTTEISYMENPKSEFIKSNNFSYAIVVVGEHPYTEMFGDSTNLTIANPGPSIITNVCGNVKCVVVIISGRPVVIEPYMSVIDALVAAWLLGSEGQGVADVLFGDHEFTGKLSRTWFRTVDQLPMNIGDSHYNPLFPYGFGLTTKSVIER